MPSKQPRRGFLNIRFSDTGKWIMDELQEVLGLSQSSIVEMLLREEARRRGIEIPGSGAYQARKEEHEALAQSINDEAQSMRAGRKS